MPCSPTLLICLWSLRHFTVIFSSCCCSFGLHLLRAIILPAIVPLRFRQVDLGYRLFSIIRHVAGSAAAARWSSLVFNGFFSSLSHCAYLPCGWSLTNRRWITFPRSMRCEMRALISSLERLNRQSPVDFDTDDGLPKHISISRSALYSKFNIFFNLNRRWFYVVFYVADLVLYRWNLAPLYAI